MTAAHAGRRHGTLDRYRRFHLKLSHLGLLGLGLFILQMLLSVYHINILKDMHSFEEETPREHNLRNLIKESSRSKLRHPTAIQSLPTPAIPSNFTKEELVPNSPYTYSFIVGSIHEGRVAYKGFLWNVLIAVHSLQRLGSKADFVAYLQLAPDSKLNEPPVEDIRILSALKIHVIVMEKPSRAAFVDLMFDKFRALQLTQYRRVLYLDSDVWPISNLDYLFQLSDPEDTKLPTILQPNVIQASAREPSNGGMFMMHPTPDAYERLQGILSRQRKEGKLLPYPNFDNHRGWGHNFKETGDSWHAVISNGTYWKFHGGFADQGLLYYFFKYELQDVSAIIGSRIEHWETGEKEMNTNNSHSTTPQLKGTSDDGILLKYSQDPAIHFQGNKCPRHKRNEWKFDCYPPYRDIIHFSGKSKPWQNPYKENQSPKPYLWFVELQKLNKLLNLDLDFSNWNTKYLPGLKESPLGYVPLNVDNHHRIFGRNITANVTSSTG